MSNRNNQNQGCMILNSNGEVLNCNDQMASNASTPVQLREGEIAVIFCTPIIGRPTRRLRDINLMRGQFARIRCGLNTLNVSCGRQVDRFPAETRTLSPGEFVVITCDC
ncbi:hypothetical protein [Scopulibacillus cellulosilyticus]|uniref:Uncharacterized protein n=1 Tax=Scopulibacillus cellulosilyticus TaxID=2665665 RepID=A0ABW2PXN5_9BACL